MGRRKTKTTSRRAHRRRSADTPDHAFCIHKPLIDVSQRLDAAVRCSDRLVPPELSLVIGGYYRDCLAHHVKDRLEANYYELQMKTNYSRHARALLQEMVLYMETYRDNVDVIVVPTIQWWSSLFFTNPRIKSDIFQDSFAAVLRVVQQDLPRLGSLLIEYLFAVLDTYQRPTESSSATAPTSEPWNSQCVRQWLEVDAMDVVLEAVSQLVAPAPCRPSHRYGAEDALRMGWVVAKVVGIHLQDHPDSRHADVLSRFHEASSEMEREMEALTLGEESQDMRVNQ